MRDANVAAVLHIARNLFGNRRIPSNIMSATPLTTRGLLRNYGIVDFSARSPETSDVLFAMRMVASAHNVGHLIDDEVVFPLDSRREDEYRVVEGKGKAEAEPLIRPDEYLVVDEKGKAEAEPLIRPDEWIAAVAQFEERYVPVYKTSTEHMTFFDHAGGHELSSTAKYRILAYVYAISKSNYDPSVTKLLDAKTQLHYLHDCQRLPDKCTPPNLEDLHKIEALGSGTFGSATLMANSAKSEYYVQKKFSDSYTARNENGDEGLAFEVLKEKKALKYTPLFVKNPPDKDHPLVSLYAAFPGQNTDVQKLIGEKVRLPVFVNIMNHVFHALNVMHSGEVFHNDVKPANLFYNVDHVKPQLGDFGLCSEGYDPGRGGTPLYSDKRETFGMNQRLIDLALHGKVYRNAVTEFEGVRDKWACACILQEYVQDVAEHELLKNAAKHILAICIHKGRMLPYISLSSTSIVQPLKEGEEKPMVRVLQGETGRRTTEQAERQKNAQLRERQVKELARTQAQENMRKISAPKAPQAPVSAVRGIQNLLGKQARAGGGQPAEQEDEEVDVYAGMTFHKYSMNEYYAEPWEEVDFTAPLPAEPHVSVSVPHALSAPVPVHGGDPGRRNAGFLAAALLTALTLTVGLVPRGLQ